MNTVTVTLHLPAELEARARAAGLLTDASFMELITEKLGNRNTPEQLAELEDEAKWDALFAKTQDKLAASGQKAREQIAAGLDVPMDYDAL